MSPGSFKKNFFCQISYFMLKMDYLKQKQSEPEEYVLIVLI